MGLVAASMRATVGLVFVAVAVLYFPIQLWTPIMSGVGILMVVNGCLGVWKVGRDRPPLRVVTRALIWGFSLACVGIFALMSVVGAGAFGPDWHEMVPRQEPATFVPYGVETP